MSDPSIPPGSALAPLFSLPLAHGHCVGIAIPAVVTRELRAALHPEEQRLLDTLPSGRQPSFAAGRVALRVALHTVGAPEGPLLVDDRGGPLLRSGARGSISHKRALAVGLAAPASHPVFWNVGVDVEEMRPLKVDISNRVLTEGELTRWRGMPTSERDHDLITRFSLKEALYKAVNGFLRRFVSWRAVEVTSIDEQGRVSFAGSLFEESALTASDIEGWVLQPMPGFILSTVRACWPARADIQA